MAKVATTSFYAPAGDGSERLVREGHVVADTDPVVEGREARVHRMPPGPDRWKERSRTFDGIAAAMASQWASEARAAA